MADPRSARTAPHCPASRSKILHLQLVFRKYWPNNKLVLTLGIKMNWPNFFSKFLTRTELNQIYHKCILRKGLRARELSLAVTLGKGYIDFNCSIHTKWCHWNYHQRCHLQISPIPISLAVTQAAPTLARCEWSLRRHFECVKLLLCIYTWECLVEKQCFHLFTYFDIVEP